jgi:hypothetical protein
MTPIGQPQPQQMQMPTKQSILRNVQISVGTMNNERVLVIDAFMEQIVLPMNDEAAEKIGRLLIAPHVISPMNGHRN